MSALDVERDDSKDEFCGLWEGILQNQSSCIIKTAENMYEVWQRDNYYLFGPYRKMHDAITTTKGGVRIFTITITETLSREYVLLSDVDKTIKNGEYVLIPNINSSFFIIFIGNKIAAPGFDYNPNNSIRFLENLNNEITKNYRNRSLNLDTMTSFKDLWEIFRDLNLKVNTGNRYLTDIFSGKVINVNRFQKNFLDLFAKWEKSGNSMIEYKYKINKIVTYKINNSNEYKFINLIKNKKFYIIVNFEPKVNEVCKIIPGVSRVKTNIFNNDKLNNFNFRTAGHFNNGIIGSSFVTPKKVDATFQIALRSPLHIENSTSITLKIKNKEYSIKIESGFYYLDELASVINEKIIENGIINITIIFVNRFDLLTGNNMNYEILTTFGENDFKFHIKCPKLKKVLHLDELLFIADLDQKYVKYNHFRTVKNIKNRHCYSDLSSFIKINNNDSTIMTSIGNGHFPENYWSFIETVASLNFESNIEEHQDMRIRYIYDFNGELLIPDNKTYDIYFNNNFNNLDTYRIIYTSPMPNFCLSISPSITAFTTVRLGSRSSLISTVSILGKKNMSKLRNNFGYLFKNYLEKTYQFQYRYFLYKEENGNEIRLSPNNYDFFEFNENQQKLTRVTNVVILQQDLTSKVESILNQRRSNLNSSNGLFMKLSDVNSEKVEKIILGITFSDDAKSTITININDNNLDIGDVPFDSDQSFYKIDCNTSLNNLSSVSLTAIMNDDNYGSGSQTNVVDLFHLQICISDDLSLFETHINEFTTTISKQEIINQINSSDNIDIKNENFYERINVPQPALKAGVIKKNIIKNLLTKSNYSTSVSSNVNILYYYLTCLILIDYSQNIRSALIRLSKKLEIDHVIADMRDCRGGLFGFDYIPFGFNTNAGIKLIDNINYFSSYTAPSKNLNYVSTFNSLEYLKKLDSNSESDSSTNKNLIAETLKIVPSIRTFYYNIGGETYMKNTQSFYTSSNPSLNNEFYNKNDKMNISILFDVNSISAARSCHNVLNNSINDKNQTRELIIDDPSNHQIKFNKSRYFLVGEVEGLFATASIGWPQSNFPDTTDSNIKFSIKNAINPTSIPINLRVRPQLLEYLISENGIKAGADDYNSSAYRLDRIINTTYNDFMFNVGLSKNKYTNIDDKSSFRDLSFEKTLLITITGNKNANFSDLEKIDIFKKV